MANPEQRKKNKKKSNFLRNAKKLGKKGHFGKGKRVSEEEYNYYIRVFEQLKHVEGEDKGKTLLFDIQCFIISSFFIYFKRF